MSGEDLARFWLKLPIPQRRIWLTAAVRAQPALRRFFDECQASVCVAERTKATNGLVALPTQRDHSISFYKNATIPEGLPLR